MDLMQAAKTIQWLDDERRKDKQELVSLQERLAAITNENTALSRKLQQFETSLATTNASIQRLTKVDEAINNYRKEVARQLEELEQRRIEAGREEEKLRKLERDGANKSLAELRKAIEPIPALDRDLQARKEEETRVARLLAELQKRVGEFNKYVDERNRSVTLVEEGRRQDAKRITDLQGEVTELRKRQDDNRGKLEVLEDIVRRTDMRIAEVTLAENERRSAQAQWIDGQAILQAERDRAWAELKERTENGLEKLSDYAHRVEQYAEGNREIRRAADEYRHVAEIIERRIAEAAEIQRLNEERLRQDWAAFVADEQKRWATHMLLRDEQWREHDRLSARQAERVEALAQQVAALQDLLRQSQGAEAERMKKILALARDMAADYEQHFAKVK